MRGSLLALSVLGDVVFGGREVGGVLGESAMMSTGVLGGSVVCGGVVMVGGRTGLVVAGLVVAGGLVDGVLSVDTAEGIVGVLLWGGVLRLRLRVSLGVLLPGCALGRAMLKGDRCDWSEVDCEVVC